MFWFCMAAQSSARARNDSWTSITMRALVMASSCAPEPPVARADRAGWRTDPVTMVRWLRLGTDQAVSAPSVPWAGATDGVLATDGRALRGGLLPQRGSRLPPARARRHGRRRAQGRCRDQGDLARGVRRVLDARASHLRTRATRRAP